MWSNIYFILANCYPCVIRYIYCVTVPRNINKCGKEKNPAWICIFKTDILPKQLLHIFYQSLNLNDNKLNFDTRIFLTYSNYCTAFWLKPKFVGIQEPLHHLNTGHKYEMTLTLFKLGVFLKLMNRCDWNSKMQGGCEQHWGSCRN